LSSIERRTVSSELARDRQRHGHDGALGGRVRRLADLAVERSDAGRVDDGAPLAVAVGLGGGHASRCQSNGVEGAGRVDLQHLEEELECVRPVAAEHLGWRRDAGAVHQRVDLATEAALGDVERRVDLRIR